MSKTILELRVAATKKRVSDYLLSKFKKALIVSSKWQHILQVNAYAISTTIPTDILTIRTAGFDFPFKDVIKFAEEKGYTEVVCNFCQNAIKAEAAPYFSLKSNYLPAKETVIKSFKHMPKKRSENSKSSLLRFFKR